ncbi:hypothetical protein Bbelb_030890 [Branchiostoma belcheri]|nr:hypothetical protein Bbelb_030890 [Branchiostoma belcheri]
MPPSQRPAPVTGACKHRWQVPRYPGIRCFSTALGSDSPNAHNITPFDPFIQLIDTNVAEFADVGLQRPRREVCQPASRLCTLSSFRDNWCCCGFAVPRGTTQRHKEKRTWRLSPVTRRAFPRLQVHLWRSKRALAAESLACQGYRPGGGVLILRSATTRPRTDTKRLNKTKKE